MAYLNNIAAELLAVAQANEPYVQLASFFGLFGCIFLLVNRWAEVRHRIRQRAIAFRPVAAIRYAEEAAGTPTFGAASDVRTKLEQASELLYKIERGLGDGREATISKLRQDLVQAGYFEQRALIGFYIARFAMASLLGIAAVGTMMSFGFELGVVPTGIAGLFGTATGLIIPGFYLSYRRKAVRRQCQMGFPDFLDLLIVCAQAGIPPRAAIERISRDVATSYPYLGANLFLAYLQVRAGLPLTEAMEGLGRRIDLQEVRSFGLLLKQTEELGTKLSDALRVYSQDMRAKRMLRAEERAYALPVKLVLPLALFVFPVMMVVIFTPIVVRIKTTLF